MKRLFYDIETSLGIVSAFQIGWDKTITYKDIIVEPAIICICYKWENESKIYSLEWHEGNDKRLIKDFLKIIEGADEIIAHNGDGFDLPWIRGRALFHRINMRFDYPSVDTLKMAKQRAGKGFRIQSRRLDYLAQYLGVGKKIPTDLSLWQRISYPVSIPTMYPKTKDYNIALAHMVKYCKMDVQVLEDVYHVLVPYVPHKYNAASVMGEYDWSCPHCGSGEIKKKGFNYNSIHTKRQRMQCKVCQKKYTVTEKVTKEYDQFLYDLKKFNKNL